MTPSQLPSSATAAGERRWSAEATSKSPATRKRKARRLFAAALWFGIRGRQASCRSLRQLFKIASVLVGDVQLICHPTHLSQHGTLTSLLDTTDVSLQHFRGGAA